MSAHAERIAAIVLELAKRKMALAQPMQRKELSELEARQGITLPEELRDFVLLAGASSSGPGFGLMSPAEAMSRNPKAAPRDPFPFSTAQANAIGRERLIDKNEHAMLEGWTMPGTLTLAGHGCGWESAIVVTGEQRGFIWYGGDGWWPEGRVLGRGRGRRFEQLGFLDWYERWLDRNIN